MSYTQKPSSTAAQFNSSNSLSANLDLFVPIVESAGLPKDYVPTTAVAGVSNSGGDSGGTADPTYTTDNWGSALLFASNTKAVAYSEAALAASSSAYTLFAVWRPTAAGKCQILCAGTPSAAPSMVASTDAYGLFLNQAGNAYTTTSPLIQLTVNHAHALAISVPANTGSGCTATAYLWDYDATTPAMQKSTFAVGGSNNCFGGSPTINGRFNGWNVPGKLNSAGVAMRAWADADFLALVTDPAAPVQQTAFGLPTYPLNLVSSNRTTISLSLTNPVGGTAPYTKTLYRLPSATANVTDAGVVTVGSGDTLSDTIASPPAQDTPIVYRARYRDSAATPAQLDTDPFFATLWGDPLVCATLGDSWLAGGGELPDGMCLRLGILCGPRKVINPSSSTYGANAGQLALGTPGINTVTMRASSVYQTWLNYLATYGVNFVIVELGINDDKYTGPTISQSETAVRGIFADIRAKVATAKVVWMRHGLPTPGGSYPADWNGSSLDKMLAFDALLAKIEGDTAGFYYGRNRIRELIGSNPTITNGDRIHPDGYVRHTEYYGVASGTVVNGQTVAPSGAEIAATEFAFACRPALGLSQPPTSGGGIPRGSIRNGGEL